jgi:pentatricopeptide repeat protein
MRRSSLVPDTITYNTLIHAYYKTTNTSNVVEIMKRMSWNGYGNCGRDIDAMDVCKHFIP